MTKLRNFHMAFYLAIAGLVLLGLLFFAYNATATEPVVSLPFTPKVEKEVLVVADNPFELDGTTGSFIREEKRGDHTTLSSSISYNVTGDLHLDNSFINTGAKLNRMDGTDAVVISYEYTFRQDGRIIWDEDELAGENYRWKPHPGTMYVKQGAVATVSHTSTDGGQTWVSDVVVE